MLTLSKRALMLYMRCNHPHYASISLFHLQHTLKTIFFRVCCESLSRVCCESVFRVCSAFHHSVFRVGCG